MLFQAAWLDQLVPNAATSALVRAGGFPLLGDKRPRSELFQTEPPIALPAKTTVTFDGTDVAGGLVVFDNADHGYIGNRCTDVIWTFDPPYERQERFTMQNPTASAQQQAAHFLATGLAGDPEILAIEAGVRNPEDCPCNPNADALPTSCRE
ncbi:MAG: hypothetical protein D6761_04220 [Candidatus Dadabacteria bacterium]|nr:MAG: hypothetical protein D6761_04220 [Candidatus Dadabacteria bacterium]